jgi:hypothetical protein
MEPACVDSGSMTVDSMCGPRGDLSSAGAQKGTASIARPTDEVSRAIPGQWTGKLQGSDNSDPLRDFDRAIGRRDLPDKEMLAGENRKNQSTYPQSEGNCQSE